MIQCECLTHTLVSTSQSTQHPATTTVSFVELKEGNGIITSDRLAEWTSRKSRVFYMAFAKLGTVVKVKKHGDDLHNIERYKPLVKALHLRFEG